MTWSPWAHCELGVFSNWKYEDLPIKAALFFYLGWFLHQMPVCFTACSQLWGINPYIDALRKQHNRAGESTMECEGWHVRVSKETQRRIELIGHPLQACLYHHDTIQNSTGRSELFGKSSVHTESFEFSACEVCMYSWNGIPSLYMTYCVRPCRYSFSSSSSASCSGMVVTFLVLVECMGLSEGTVHRVGNASTTRSGLLQSFS